MDIFMQRFPAATQSFAHYVLHLFILLSLAGELQCCSSKSRYHQRGNHRI